MPSSVGNFFVFLGKEFQENMRTKKFLVLACVFVFFGITSPLLARYMGEFLYMLLPADEAFVLALVPDPVWTDSYDQFYGNISQTGAIVIILMYMGLILREKRSGTAALVFCKGVSPAPFVLAKFVVASVGALFFLTAAVFANHGYTELLFGRGGQMRHVLVGAGAYGVFLVMTIAWVILASTLAKSTAISAVLGFLGFIAVITVSAIPRLGRFLPGNLMTRNVALTLGETYPEFAANLGITAGLTVLFLGLAILVLKKQEL